MQLSSFSESGSVKFGTSGLRGLVSDMTPSLCYAYASAFIQSIANSAEKVVIGHDLRPSSPEITAACIAAIEQAGKKPIYVGVLPTPAIASFALSISSPAIVVTGSHIPFDRNGIKFYRMEGEITKSDEEAMQREDVLMPKSIPLASLPTIDARAYEAYVSRYVDFFGANALSGSKVLFYEHSSAARDILHEILSGLGCEVISVGRTNEFVPIDTEAVRPEDEENAKRWAKEYHFDAVFSTDGDADRPLLGDENGNSFRGDVVGVLCAKFLKAGGVVVPVSCNSSLELSGFFKTVHRTRIGSPYVIEGMSSLDEEIIVGYEANGGFLLGTNVSLGKGEMTALPTRDAVLPMLALMFLAKESKCTLSQLLSVLPPRFTYSNRLQQVETEFSKRLLEDLEVNQSILRQVVPLTEEITQLDKTDGLRIYFNNGEIIHFRPSGNAPELRCYCEADTPERAEYLCDQSLQGVMTLIKARG